MKLSNTALFYRMEREKAMYWLSTKKAKIIMLLPTLMIYSVFIIKYYDYKKNYKLL